MYLISISIYQFKFFVTANTIDRLNPSQFSNYSDDCSGRFSLRCDILQLCMSLCHYFVTLLRCESGDLSGKHGKLSIFPDIPIRSVVSFVDTNLALTGSFSGIILTSSVTLYNVFFSYWAIHWSS